MINKLSHLVAVGALLGASANYAGANLSHRYSFNDGTANDSWGAAHGTLAGGATVSGGSLMLGGSGAHASLPGDTIQINTYSQVTLEMWLTSSSANTSFTMAGVLGRTYNPGLGEPDWAGYQYIMIQPTRADGYSRIAITRNRFEEESGVNGPGQINDGIEHHIAVTIDSSSLSYYLDGGLLGSVAIGENTLDKLSNDLVYLGRSVYQFDPYFVGSINEFRIWNNALSASDVLSSFQAGPNVVPEPSSLALIGLGVAALALRRRR